MTVCMLLEFYKARTTPPRSLPLRSLYIPYHMTNTSSRRRRSVYTIQTQTLRAYTDVSPCSSTLSSPAKHDVSACRTLSLYHCPVRHLPLELLQLVFHYAKEVDPPHSYPGYMYPGWFRILSVCSWWRSVSSSPNTHVVMAFAYVHH